MNPLLYSLCQKPVIGLALFISSACAFPPLFWDEPLALQQAGAALTKAFEAPVDKSYSLLLHFHFPSAAAVRGDEVVGERYDSGCERAPDALPAAQRMGLGRTIPVHVVIRDKTTGAIRLDRRFDTLCLTSHGAHGQDFVKTRTAARVALPKGAYVIEMRNPEAQPGLDGVRTAVSLVPGDRK